MAAPGGINQPPVQRAPTRGPFQGVIATPDLMGEAASVTLSNTQGTTAQVVHRVSGLTGTTLIQRLHQAVTAPGIPVAGFIDNVLGVPVASVRAEMFPNGIEDQAKVTVTYGLVLGDGGGGFDNDPDDVDAIPQIEILTTLQPVTSQFDVGGNVLLVDNYVRTLRDAAGDPIGSELQPPQAGEVETTADMYTIIARRRERESPGVSKGPTFTNTINSTVVFSDPIHTWKCAVGGSSDDGGATWNVVYEFQRNHPDTHNVVVVWRDPETGLPGAEVTRPSDMTPGSMGNGSKVARMFDATEFRGLQLPIFD